MIGEAEGILTQNPCKSRGSVTDVKRPGLSLQGRSLPNRAGFRHESDKKGSGLIELTVVINAILVLQIGPLPDEALTGPSFMQAVPRVKVMLEVR